MRTSLMEETLAAFEKRMEMRRQMMKATGVRLGKSDMTPDMENRVRDSILKCHGCVNSDTCEKWLQFADHDAHPPAFCPNSDFLLQLRAEGHVPKG